MISGSPTVRIYQDFRPERMNIVARRCELTGKSVQAGNKVSHANNKSRRRFIPNLCTVTLLSERLRENVTVRVSAHGLRSVEHRGGIDAFLTSTRADSLSPRLRRLKARLSRTVPETVPEETVPEGGN